MNKDIYTVRKLKNADGKRLNVKTKLEYAKEISENLRHRSITTSAIYLDEIKQHESKFSTILGDIVFDK